MDVSQTMLARLSAKAAVSGLDNIECCQGGLLTYVHAGEPVDAVVCIAVLHHLPDMRKLIGLSRYGRRGNDTHPG